MGNYLAFDLGASSGRGIIGTIEDGRLALEEIHRFPNGPVEIDGSLYWDYGRLVGELRAGLAKAVAARRNLDGIAIDTWGVDYVLFGRADGKMRRMPYNYRDSRTDAAARKLAERIPLERLYEMTGIQHMSINTLFQLAAHLSEHPEDFEDSAFLPIPDALAFGLGGDFTAEYSHCSTTELLDPRSRQWHWKLIEEVGLPKSAFPRIVPSCSRGGLLSEDIASELGCARIPIWKVGEHDTASAVAAVPAPESGEWAYLSAGTWALLGAEIDSPYISDKSRTSSFTNEGGLGGKIRFLTNIMGSWLFQELRRNWNVPERKVSFSDMESWALAAEKGKFLVNPNDQTFAQPCNMPERISAFCERTGQGRPSTEGAVVRAVYDSLALYFRNKLRELESLLGVKYQTFNVVGGGTKDGLLMQLTADAMGIPVIAGPVEATATGNILGQAIAAGELSGLAEARQVVRNSFEVRTYAPRPEMTSFYEEVGKRFAGIAE